MARIDNSTGMDDYQPHGQHINNRDPCPAILGDFEHNDSDDDEHSEDAGETSPYFALALSANNLDESDDTDEDNDRLEQQRAIIRNMNMARSTNIARAHQTRQNRTPSALVPVSQATVSPYFANTTRQLRSTGLTSSHVPQPPTPGQRDVTTSCSTLIDGILPTHAPFLAQDLLANPLKIQSLSTTALHQKTARRYKRKSSTLTAAVVTRITTIASSQTLSL
jgi:hypothetical protein